MAEAHPGPAPGRSPQGSAELTGARRPSTTRSGGRVLRVARCTFHRLARRLGAHALAGQPVAAMELVALGIRLRIPRFDGCFAQVVVAVDADDLDRAARHVRVQAEQAASGRFIGQVNDTFVLLATLQLAEGNVEQARDLFAKPNSHRGPMGWILSVHVAQQLGVVVEHRQRIQEWAGHTEQQRADNRIRNMGILRTEMAHRGWI